MSSLHILCGTDFSPAAKSAADAAVSLASSSDATLLLVHASDDPGRPEVQAAMDAEAQRIRQLAPKVALETRVLSGFPDEVLRSITTAADGPRIGLLVLGAQGRREPSSARLGATVERTVETTTIATLVVREADSFRALSPSPDGLKVVLADDGSMTKRMLEPLDHFFRKWELNSTLIHVTDAPLVHEREKARLVADLRERARGFASPSNQDVQCALTCREGSRSQTLVAQAESLGARLLVVGNRHVHGPSRLWSETVTRGVLYRARINVLIVPSPPALPAGPVQSDLLHPASQGEGDALQIMKQLDSHPFLRGVPGDKLASIAAIAEVVASAPGSVLFREGEPADSIYLVLQGNIALDVHSAGTSPVRVETLGPASVLGFSWLFPPFRWHLDASAIGPVTSIRLPAKAFSQLLEQDPVLDHLISRKLVRELYERLERARLARLDIYQGGVP